VNVDEFMDVLVNIQLMAPHMNVWQIHQAFFKPVCPRAFYDSVLDRILSAESSVSEYKGAIGSLSEKQTRESLLGFDIPYSQLIEAFDIVRSAKNEFKRMEDEEAAAKIKNSPKGKSSRKILGDT